MVRSIQSGYISVHTYESLFSGSTVSLQIWNELSRKKTLFEDVCNTCDLNSMCESERSGKLHSTFNF